MSRLTLSFTLILVLTHLGFAQQSNHQMQMDMKPKASTPAPTAPAVSHPVSTRNPEAQKFFDQGLTFVYAFNHEAAIQSFKRAAELDPQMPMAYWGIALALGPNINSDVDPEREKAAFEAAQKALSLVTNASDSERDYIQTLVKRYSLEPKADLRKLAVDYKNAMGDLVKKYPDDLDAATLYAESAMNLRPWQLWSSDGKPAEGTEEIIAVLESVLRRNPNHIGAIHYYIHAVEASPNPDRALAYAPKLPLLIPTLGHLVHMPAHIYQRTGDYDAAAASNRDAAQVDEAFFKANGDSGVYPLMYYTHNLHFLAVANSMAGRFADSMSAAKRLETYVGRSLKMMPMLEGFMPTSTLISVRFAKWDDIMKLPPPDKSLIATSAVFHFARGVAFAKRKDTEKAEIERKALLEMKKVLPSNFTFGLNSGDRILQIADDVLAARIAEASGDREAAINLLRQAIGREDALAYDEPPAWFMPVRETLGATLLRKGDYTAAEEVFRADLKRNRRNGRSLFGLVAALKGQHKDYAATLVEKEFQSAWKNSDTKLSLDDL